MLFLGMSVREFSGKINVSVHGFGLDKADCPSQCEWVIANLQMAWTRQKRQRDRNLSFCSLSTCLRWDISLSLSLDWDLYPQLPYFSSLLTFYTAGFLVFSLLNKDLQIMRLLACKVKWAKFSEYLPPNTSIHTGSVSLEYYTWYIFAYF